MMKILYSDKEEQQEELSLLYPYSVSDKDNSIPCVAICRENFFRIGSILTKEKSASGINDFELTPFDSIESRWEAYFNELSEIKDFEFSIVDKELNALLQTIDKNCHKCTEADLLRALGPVCNHAFIGPRFLLVDPTVTCNLDCIYCRLHSGLRKERKLQYLQKKSWDETASFDWDLMQEIIKDAASIGVEQICIVGEGEPTLYPQFKELLSLVRELGLAINLHTNGLNLSDELIDHIVECDVNTLTISVSGLDEASYKLIHPTQKRGTYERLRSQILKLNLKKEAARLKRDTCMRVEVLQVVHKHNYQNMIQMVTDAKELHADRIWFQMLHVNDFSRFLKLEQHQIDTCRFLLAEAKELAASLSIDVADYMDLQIEHAHADGTWSKNIFEEYGCMVGWMFSYIFLGADVSFCCGHKIFDNLNQNRFQDAWKGNIYHQWRKAALDFDWGKNPVGDNGVPLLDAFCHNCDNHNFNTMMIGLLEDLELLPFLGGRYRRNHSQFSSELNS
jgi:MoaA/NifB/PqqE/SkfB family radical SAM enzyme